MTFRGHVTSIIVLVAIGFVVGGALVGAADAETLRGEPELDVYLPDGELQQGTETKVSFAIQNDAVVRSGIADERITTARAVSIEVTDDGPFDIDGEERPVGSLPDGAMTEVPFDVEVPDDVEPGTYEVDVRIRYSVTNMVTEDDTQRLTRSDTQTLEITVPDEPRFAVGDVATNVQPGTAGDAEIELENVGTATAFDADVQLVGGSDLTVGEGGAERFLGDLEPGESRTVVVEVTLPESAGEGERPFEAIVEYEDERGIERAPKETTGYLSPLSEQSFAVESLEDTLAVGFDGEMTGTLVNEGPRTIDDGVLVVEPMSDSLFVEDTRYALPELEPGESAAFEYPTDVSGQADPGPRQVRFTVEYSVDDRTLSSDPISKRVVVDPFRDEFDLEIVETTVTAGESSDLVLEITNQHPETLENIDALLYADSPLEAPGDEAFVSELEPGESAAIDFEIAADADARATTYPVELDFEYRTPDGTTEVSDAYQVPVDVLEGDTSDDDGGTSAIALGAGGLIVLVGAGGAVLWYRRD